MSSHGVREFWWTESLWAAAEALPVALVAIADIAEFDQNCWFGDRPPTCREVAEHARGIETADLSHPVILNASGGLMDGGHRIARVWLDGRTEVDAVRFEADPPNSETWLVEHEGNSYVAKSVGRDDVADLLAGAEAATALAEAGLVTGRPVPTADGSMMAVAAGVALLKYVPGRELEGDSADEQRWTATRPTDWRSPGHCCTPTPFLVRSSTMTRQGQRA